MEPLRIHLWSGPRNVSTAIMYAFAQRPDTTVVDEPLYGHYLRVSGALHPGRDEVLAAMDTDGESVVRKVLLGDVPTSVVFYKQMAHHLVELGLDFLADARNVLLIRDPADVVRSLRHQIPHPTLEDTGIAAQTRLFDHLRGRGQEVPILDARELLANPEAVLRKLCEGLGLRFDPTMLSWPPGPIAADGVWAPHWYHNIHRSSGFGPYSEKDEPVPDDLAGVVAESRPHYDRLHARALRADSGA